MPKLKVDHLTRLKTRIVKRPSGCWEWTGRTDRYGYGVFSMDGRSWGAHRAHYHLAVEPLTTDIHLHHTCGNPSCVNPKHLKPTTLADHISHHKRHSHCRNGHPLTPDNLIKHRSRACRICHNAYHLRRYHQAKA